MERNKIYERLNNEAKAYFEYLLKKDFNNKKTFKKELDYLEGMGILFFIKALYDYRKKYNTDVILYDSKHLYDSVLEFFNYFYFKIDNKDISDRNTDIIIELVGAHPFIFNDFINKEYNNDFNTISITPDEDEYYYFLMPTFVASKEMKELCTNIHLHFNEYMHLEMESNPREIWDGVKNSFITYEVIDKIGRK